MTTDYDPFQDMLNHVSAHSRCPVHRRYVPTSSEVPEMPPGVERAWRRILRYSAVAFVPVGPRGVILGHSRHVDWALADALAAAYQWALAGTEEELEEHLKDLCRKYDKDPLLTFAAFFDHRSGVQRAAVRARMLLPEDVVFS